MKFDPERLRQFAASCRAWAEILRGVAAALLALLYLILCIWAIGKYKGIW